MFWNGFEKRASVSPYLKAMKLQMRQQALKLPATASSAAKPVFSPHAQRLKQTMEAVRPKQYANIRDLPVKPKAG